MIKCEICGFENKHSIHRHVTKIHNITVNEYKKKYNTEVYSFEYRQKISKNVSNQMRKRWDEDLDFKERHLKKLHAKKIRNKISNTLKEKYKNGEIKIWNIGRTKDNDVRVRGIGKKNKNHLTGRTKETHDYIKKAAEKRSVILSELWKNGRKYIPTKETNKKISETLSKKYANGEITTYHNGRFKTGWYVGKKDKFYYMSGLEEKTMIFLDNNEKILEWTNKHGIRVKYIDENGVERIYVPDFLIKLKNNMECIIEMKGFNLNPERVKLKKKYIKKIYKNYYIIKTISALEKKINEINKNKQNR